MEFKTKERIMSAAISVLLVSAAIIIALSLLTSCGPTRKVGPSYTKAKDVPYTIKVKSRKPKKREYVDRGY